MFSRPCKARKPQNATLAASSLITPGFYLAVFVVVCKTGLTPEGNGVSPSMLEPPEAQRGKVLSPHLRCASPQLQCSALLYPQRVCNTTRHTQARVVAMNTSMVLRYEKVLALFRLQLLTKDHSLGPLQMTAAKKRPHF